jgi:hypothetical protein
MKYRERLLDLALLFGLGALTIPLADMLVDTDLPDLWKNVGPLIALGVACCVVEVLAIRSTGRHHWFGSWLPAALGFLAASIEARMRWQAEYGGFVPDAGTAMGMFLTNFIIGVPIFAAVVNVTAALAAHLCGPLAPRARDQNRHDERP